MLEWAPRRIQSLGRSPKGEKTSTSEQISVKFDRDHPLGVGTQSCSYGACKPGGSPKGRKVANFKTLLLQTKKQLGIIYYM